MSNPPTSTLRAFAEDIPIEILHLDQDVIAVKSRPGLVVHAGAGQHSGTLVNALLHRFQTLSSVGGDERPGIVHRIDKETSGVLAGGAHRRRAPQTCGAVPGRKVEKTYLALVQGRLAKQDEGTSDTRSRAIPCEEPA